MSLFGQPEALQALMGLFQTVAEGGDERVFEAVDSTGLITARVQRGVVLEVTMAPRAIRAMSTEDLSLAVVKVVNEALESHRNATTAELPPLRGTLDAAVATSAKAEQQFAEQLSALDRAMQQVERLATRQSGGVRPSTAE